MDKDQVLLRRREMLAELAGRMVDCRLSQKEMAEAVGASPSQVSLWLGAKSNIWLDTYIKLSLACDEKVSAVSNPYEIKEEPTRLQEESVPYGSISLGGLVKAGLRNRKMSQKELAERVGTSQSRISEYIRGTVVPSLGVAARICRELEIDADEFLRACSGL
ncbi:MAG: helix-turn-helix transcriptional regulator [Bacteroidales bacterium]|nr:helix-turn-helix transcriptional regulator [Bacteroidales bacterium]